MTENIIQVDLSKIDSEILSIESEISALEAKKAKKLDVKDFLINNALPKNGHTVAATVIATAAQYGGISDFIVNFLGNNPGVDTRAVITAYASHTGKSYDDISNNISNALSRLKDTKIRGVEKPEGGRKAGLNWYKI